MAEVDETIEETQKAGLDINVERGANIVVLTVNARRWILCDDAELVVMLALYAGPEAQRAWLARRPVRDIGPLH